MAHINMFEPVQKHGDVSEHSEKFRTRGRQSITCVAIIHQVPRRWKRLMNLSPVHTPITKGKLVQKENHGYRSDATRGVPLFWREFSPGLLGMLNGSFRESASFLPEKDSR